MVSHSIVFCYSVGTSNPPGADGVAAIAVKVINRAHVSDDHPVIDVADAEVVRVVDVKNVRLPNIIGVGLVGTGLFDVQLLDGECVRTRERDVIGAALGAYPTETGGVIGGGKLDAMQVRTQRDVVAVGVLIGHDAGVVAGDHYIAQDGQCRVVIGWRDESLGAVSRLGGLHVVDAGVDRHIVEPALHGIIQVDATDLRIVVGPDVEVADDHVDCGEITVECAASSRDDRRPGSCQALEDGAFLPQRERSDGAPDRRRLAFTDDFDGDPARDGLGNRWDCDPPAIDAIR